MADIDLDLLIPVVLGVVPEIRKRRLEQPRADAVEVRHVAPLLLAGCEDPREGGPLRDVGLHEEDAGGVGGREGGVGRGWMEVCDEDAGAEGVALAREGEADAWGCVSGVIVVVLERTMRVYLRRRP